MSNPIQRFEDLKCWKAARILVKTVFTKSQEGPLSKDWDSRSQFRRAALSVMNNIAEGFGRFSDKDNIRFLDMAHASAYEVKSMLYFFEDVQYFDTEMLKKFHHEVDDAINLVAGFIRYLNKKSA